MRLHQPPCPTFGDSNCEAAQTLGACPPVPDSLRGVVAA